MQMFLQYTVIHAVIHDRDPSVNKGKKFSPKTGYALVPGLFWALYLA